MHKLVSKQHPDVAERLVAGVEEPQFHFFIGQDVGCHLCAYPLPSWTSVFEAVFDHPLFKGLGHDRPTISDSKLLCYQGAVFISCSWRNAVDHAVGEYAGLAQPVPETWISQLGEGSEHLPGNFAVALDVVTRHQREGGEAASPPAIESLQEMSKRAAGFVGMRQIVLNVWVTCVQFPGRLIYIITPFRDRERNNAGFGRRQLLDDLLRIVR